MSNLKQKHLERDAAFHEAMESHHKEVLAAMREESEKEKLLLRAEIRARELFDRVWAEKWKSIGRLIFEILILLLVGVGIGQVIKWLF